MAITGAGLPVNASRHSGAATTLGKIGTIASGQGPTRQIRRSRRNHRDPLGSVRWLDLRLASLAQPTQGPPCDPWPAAVQLTAYHLYAGHERLRRASNVDLLGAGQQLHDSTREQVRRESAKIFRNQWNHSPKTERHALAALALSARNLEKHSLPRLKVDQTTLSRLQPARPGIGSALGQPGSSPNAPERYTVLEEIGHSGTGTVCKAWDKQLERVVALKVLDHAIRSSPEHRAS